jgi:flagellar hook-associated protein 1
MIPGFNVASSALNTYQKAIDTVSRNVANAGREGYHREEIQLSSAPSIERGGLAFGQGVTTANLRRAGDPVLEKRISEATGEFNNAKAYSDALGQVDAMLAEHDTQFSAAQDRLRQATQDVAASPNSMAARETLIAAAQDFSTKANAYSDMLGKQAGMGTGMSADDLKAANDLAKEIATLNKNTQYLGKQSVSLTNDAVIKARELAAKVGGSYEILDNGTVNFKAADGTQMVAGDKATELKPGAGVAQGEVKGNLEANKKIAEFKQFFDSTMQEFATNFNNANSQGKTLSGATGGNIFNIGADGKLSVAAKPGDIAASSSGDPLDNGNANKLVAQLDAKSTQTGTRTLTESYAQFMSKVGNEVKSAASALQTADVSLTTLKKYDQDTYGVDLEQELVKMMEYQRVYEANAKVIQTIDSMLGTLINMKA